MDNKKHKINYLYFLLLFTGISFFSLSYFFKQENFLSGEQFFFMVYAVGQALLEVGGFLVVACWLSARGWKKTFYCWIGVSFLVLLAHYTDFTLLRLMDTSFSYILLFFLGSGFSHLYTAFLALNMNQAMVAIILVSLVVLPFIGIGLYAWTDRWSSKRPFRLSSRHLALSLGALLASLFILDAAACLKLESFAYDKYKKALPLGITFLSPKPNILHLEEPLPKLLLEKEVNERIEKVSKAKGPLPNIYFFIIETLRKDFITPEIAPSFSSFAKRHVTFADTFANANYSNPSWYALLSGNYPLSWTEARDFYSKGSPALRLLKKLGYKIRVYSSADLNYFNMYKTLFGKSGELVDHLEQYTDLRGIEPCDRDALAREAFARDLEQNGNGTLYLFFFDSTHSEYSFPKNFPLKFEPISERISYLTISRSSQDLELLKNRYRNSIHYIDSLLEASFSLLKEKGLYEESIIAMTGDHAEEFFEEGSLFHGTHLNLYQIAVPIACKFPYDQWKEKIDQERSFMSHIDLLPSMIHYLVGSTEFADLFDGESIFSPQQRAYHLAFLQNGANPPVEFTLYGKEKNIRARISGPKSLEILSSDGLSEESIRELVTRAFNTQKRAK